MRRCGDLRDDRIVHFHRSWLGYLAHNRSSVVGAIASCAAIAMIFEPHSDLASTSARFALWFAMIATGIAVGLTTLVAVADHQPARHELPRAIVRRR